MSREHSTSPASLTLTEFVMHVLEKYREHAQTMSHTEASDLAYAQALQEKLLHHRGKFTGLLSGVQKQKIRWQPQKEGQG